MSFKDLLQKAGFQESAPAPAEPEAEPAPEAIAFGPKVVVRYSRKGRGGKAVTLLSGVTSGHDALLDRLRRELGLGARREGDDLVLQGEQVERVARWIESQGVKKVVR